MHWSKLTAIVITAAMLTVACDKEEEPTINPCLNGQLDPGETAIDCGGNCGACPEVEYPNAGFNADGNHFSAATKDLTYNNGWTLNITADSLVLQLNLGNDGGVDVYPMPASGSYAQVDGVNYPTLASGTYTISEHDLTNQKLSGFFQGKFVRVPGDTLYITNGFFEYLPY